MNAPVIKVTKRELKRRQHAIFRELEVTPESFHAKIRSSDPLTDKEWSAMEELAEIEFLLGDDRP